MTDNTISVFHVCNGCGIWLSGLDKSSSKYTINKQYWVVRDPSDEENWETCNPENKFNTYCEKCHSTRLNEGMKRMLRI